MLYKNSLYHLKYEVSEILISSAPSSLRVDLDSIRVLCANDAVH